MTLKEDVFDFIDRAGGVTFVEINNQFGGGEYWISVKENLYVAINMSEEASAAIVELEKEKKILYYPSNIMVFLADGGIPQMPIAKRAIDYKTPHWQPVVMWSARSMKGKMDKDIAKMYRVGGWDV